MDMQSSNSTNPARSGTDRRSPPLKDASQREPHNKQAFIQQLKQEYLYDLLRARSHSKHFRHTRAQYISSRVRSISLILAILIPAWIAVDAFFLPADDFKTIALLRLISGAACLALFLWREANHDLIIARLKLALLVIIPSCFHTATQFFLLGNGHELPAGYHFFPFLIIGLGAIFPLTIVEGGYLASFVVGLYVVTKLLLGDLLALDSLNDIWLLTLLASIAGWAALTQLSMMMRLYRQAHRDPLIGLANRRSIVGFLEREVQQSRELDVPLSVILLDLDKFKRINDTFGHAVGDQVLRHFSELLIGQSRAEDLVGRYGGEEFLMILSSTPQQTAQQVAERLRQTCQQQCIDLCEATPALVLNFSCSPSHRSIHCCWQVWRSRRRPGSTPLLRAADRPVAGRRSGGSIRRRRVPDDPQLDAAADCPTGRRTTTPNLPAAVYRPVRGRAAEVQHQRRRRLAKGW